MQRPHGIASVLTGIVALALVSCNPGDFAGSGSTASESAVVPLPPFAAAHGQAGGAATHAAAVAFMEKLSPSQKSTLVLPWDSPLRRNWSNLPASVARFERNGLRLGDLGPTELAAVFDFLAAGLGRHGYETLADVVTAEAVLAESLLAGWLEWSATSYWLAFFGEPTPDGDWGWQFGGHHLAFNASLSAGRVVSLSPTFVGVEPAGYLFEGKHHAPLADELADAAALMQALPAPLRAEALIEDRPGEVLAGPGEDGVIPPPQGTIVGDWPADVRGMVMDLVSHWVRLQPPELATARLAAIEAELDSTRFAWIGPADGGGDIYYRIQGPTLVIELRSEGGIGDDGGHHHSVYRDPTNEYGGAL